MTSQSLPCHLLAVWNPSYEINALGRHVEILAAQCRAGEEDPQVWWGLVRSRSRSNDLPHLKDIHALDGEIDARRKQGDELQLYLTDYRSLYVGDVSEIRVTLPDDATGVPRYYKELNLSCEAWFQLEDIRLLVSDDMASTTAELAKLRNTRYNNQRVSIYGGMTDIPLIVTRPDGGRYFDIEEREMLTAGQPWVIADAERVGIGSVMQSLREDLLGARTWATLEPTSRIFLATAEEVFRTHRSDPVFDFTPVLVQLCKGVEIEMRRLLTRLFRDAPPAVATMSYNNRIRNLRERTPLSVGEMVFALSGEQPRVAWLQNTHGLKVRWLLEQGAAVLDELAGYRNPAAHETHLRIEVARRLRDRWFGVGHAGHLVELARTYAALDP